MIDLNIIQKAIALTQRGQFEEAEAIYKKLIEENPNNSNILSIFGLFYVNIRNFENDNLKVEKYNVFLKNEKNNQYNVKK